MFSLRAIALVLLVSLCSGCGRGVPRNMDEDASSGARQGLDSAPSGSASRFIANAFRPQLDIQIQLVKNAKTLELIRSWEMSVQFASNWLESMTPKEIKLQNRTIFFTILVKNTGTAVAGAGTTTRLRVTFDGKAVREKAYTEEVLNNNALVFHTESVTLPADRGVVAIDVVTDAGHIPGGAGQTRSLQLNTTLP